MWKLINVLESYELMELVYRLHCIYILLYCLLQKNDELIYTNSSHQLITFTHLHPTLICSHIIQTIPAIGRG